MKIYFLGIGGIGMSALARYAKGTGHEVYGYDRVKSKLTINLENEGISINYEDKEENIPDNIDLCIYTPAIPEDNKQYLSIKRRNIPMEKRSVALGHVTSKKKVIAVAGSHGKSTISGMIAHILSKSPVGCSAFLGAILKFCNSNFIYNSSSNYVVVEADEYDRSFLQLNPYVSVISAIDADHLDIYGTYENLYFAFEQFARLTNEKGLLLVRQDNERLIEDLDEVTPLHTYSLEDVEAENYMVNLRASRGAYYFDYATKYGVFYDMEMSYPGRHNVENAIAALSVCNFVLENEGVEHNERERILRDGILSFSGMKRRLDFIIRQQDRIFVDDYAHHPREIATTINSLRELYPQKNLTGIFQPHLYTRTRDLANDFAKSLELLDTIILLPIYPAREKPIAGVDSHLLLRKINKMDKYLVTKEQLFPLLQALEPEELVTFGAGDIDRLVPEIKKTLLEI